MMMMVMTSSVSCSRSLEPMHSITMIGMFFKGALGASVMPLKIVLFLISIAHYILQHSTIQEKKKAYYGRVIGISVPLTHLVGMEI